MGRNLAGRPIEIFDTVGAVKHGITQSELVTVSGITKISLSMLKNIKTVTVRLVSRVLIFVELSPVPFS